MPIYSNVTMAQARALGWAVLTDPQYGGADPTGATPCDAALTAAIATRQHIWLPPGTFTITTQIVVTGVSGYTICGSGRGLTKITQNTDNTGIFLVSGARLRIESMSLTWANVQTSAHTNSSAIQVLAKTSGGILSNSVIKELDITKCAKGIDLGNTIGYSCSFSNIDIESFAISAFYTDTNTAWTQCKFDVWHISNQPQNYYSGTAVGGTTTTMNLPAGASATVNYYVGMSFTINGGTGSSSATTRFITAYDNSTKIMTFYPAASAVDNTSQFAIVQQATSSDYPFKMLNFTDVHIGELAFELLTISTSVPLYLDSVSVCKIDCLRFERIVFKATNSGLWMASGRCAVIIDTVQVEYNAMLTALGCTNFYFSRTFYQGSVRLGAIEANGNTITSAALWALASGTPRSERPYGGTYFMSMLGGDGNIAPAGQSTDTLGTFRQTAILGRPEAAARGASLDEGAVTTYSHNLMNRPDVIRFNTPITADCAFALDTGNLVAGATVTVVRGTGCTGAFNILVKSGATTLITLSTAGTTGRVYCDGSNYQVIP